jgi:hypothetical protein
MAITEHLKLDVSRLLDVLLDDDMLIIKALSCLALGSVKLVEELLFVLNDSHPLAAATKRGLNDHREADLL